LGYRKALQIRPWIDYTVRVIDFTSI